MAKAVQKITLSASRDIPFNKLVLSQSNVRRLKAGVSIEELAEDIARRGLLQSLNVRPVLDADGAETGMFEIPAGGRRYRALELLVKQKRLAKTAPVPCVVRDPSGRDLGGRGFAGRERPARRPASARSVSRLQDAARPGCRRGGDRRPLLRRAGRGEAAAAPRRRVGEALDIYAEDGMTLEQLMAFTVTTDHARQEQVWEALQQSYNKEPI